MTASGSGPARQHPPDTRPRRNHQNPPRLAETEQLLRRRLRLADAGRLEDHLLEPLADRHAGAQLRVLLHLRLERAPRKRYLAVRVDGADRVHLWHVSPSYCAQHLIQVILN